MLTLKTLEYLVVHMRLNNLQPLPVIDEGLEPPKHVVSHSIQKLWS